MKKRPLRYYIAKAFYSLYLHLRLSGERNPVVVYQMGKVGSRTITESLKARHIGKDVHHVHYISKQGLENYEKLNASARRPQPGMHYWVGHYLRELTKKDDWYWDVISLVRDPIARNVSAFFHALDVLYPEFEMNLIKMGEREFIDDLKHAFLERYPHDLPLLWFDIELKPILGIDVYSKAFPKKKGYVTYQSEHARLIVIKLENLNRSAIEAFHDFLGVQDLELVQTNVSSRKSYASQYTEFIRQVSFPDSYLEEMYGSKFSKSFYTEDELANFRRKWAKI